MAKTPTLNGGQPTNGLLSTLPEQGVDRALPKDQPVDPSLLIDSGAPSPKTRKKAKTPGLDRGQLFDASGAALLGGAIGKKPRQGASLITAAQVGVWIEAAGVAGTPLAALLGHEGPLGPHGPLGAYGPIGHFPWSPSRTMAAIGDWRALSQMLAKLGGPGSDLGPLSAIGPISRSSLERLLPSFGPLGQALDGGGMLAALGPLGPLGALGGLGFLGPVGGHGYTSDADGDFVDKRGRTVRTSDVRYAGKNKRQQLFELYPESHAASMKNNDASWMIRGQLDQRDPDGDSFQFKAKKGHFVTLTVTPESQSERYAIELYDKKGKLVAQSDDSRLVNWIHARFDRDLELTVKVRRLADTNATHPIADGIDFVLAPLIAASTFSAAFSGMGESLDRLEPDRYRLSAVSSPR